MDSVMQGLDSQCPKVTQNTSNANISNRIVNIARRLETASHETSTNIFRNIQH